MLKNLLAMQIDPWIRKISGEGNDYPFPSPVFLPGEFHGQKILVGNGP